jgi:hypothetical protein
MHRPCKQRSVLVYDIVSLTQRCGVRRKESDHAEESDVVHNAEHVKKCGTTAFCHNSERAASSGFLTS